MDHILSSALSCPPSPPGPHGGVGGGPHGAGAPGPSAGGLGPHGGGGGPSAGGICILSIYIYTRIGELSRNLARIYSGLNLSFMVFTFYLSDLVYWVGFVIGVLFKNAFVKREFH